MALYSAQEDLRDKSLKSVSGGLNKLQYLADLRDTTGIAYSHWGLSRLYGEQAARKALAEEHRLLVTTLLGMPIQKLLEDVQRCSEAYGTSPESFLAKLRARKISSLLPPDTTSAAERHLSSVLHALWALVKSQAVSNPRV
jgi:hypothetical protein